MKLSLTERILLPASLLLFILGVLLRYAAIHNQLWLDEIYTLKLLANCRSPWELFTLREDNNHILNSLWAFFLGNNHTPSHLRAPAFVASLLTLILCLRLCAMRGPWQGFFGSVVFSFSYVLILYGTEARGYSMMLFCSVLSLYCFEQYRRDRNPSALVGFWLSTIGGILSHLIYIHVYFALLILTLVLWRRKEFRSARAVLQLHLAPILLIGGLVVFHFSSIHVAGGPQGSRLEVLLNSLSVPFGAPELSPSNPESGLLSLIVALSAAGMLCWQLNSLIRSHNSMAWFYAVLVFAVPILLVVVFEPQVFVLRYVLPSIFFAYFLFVQFLAELFEHSTQGKALSLCLILLFIVGNERFIVQLLAEGRGNYIEALQFVADHSAEEKIAIGGDQDFRNGLLVDYYAHQAGLEKRITYVPGQFPKASEAAWIILETQDQFALPEHHIPDSDLLYARTFESAALSGARWFLYCREASCPRVVHLR